MANIVKLGGGAGGGPYKLKNGVLVNKTICAPHVSWLYASFSDSSYPNGDNVSGYNTGWRSGYGSDARWDGFGASNDYANIFYNISLKGYTKFYWKVTSGTQYGNPLYLVIAQQNDDNSLFIRKYQVSGSTTPIQQALGFTPNDKPYIIIEGASNGYQHEVNFL